MADAQLAEVVRSRLRADADHAAPHVVDVEVLSVIRRDHMLGRLDMTAASQAVGDLQDWPGERFGHQPLLERAWELRGTVRSWDALYVALAEALEATLVTLDARLPLGAYAPGKRGSGVTRWMLNGMAESLALAGRWRWLCSRL